MGLGESLGLVQIRIYIVHVKYATDKVREEFLLLALALTFYSESFDIKMNAINIYVLRIKCIRL